jgi:hypothetical protein
MKRDLELFRRILLKVEELPPGQSLDGDLYDLPFETSAATTEIVAEHVKLLEEEGYIEADIISSPNEIGVTQVFDYSIFRLKNGGHDFLANAKNPTIWKKTTDFIANKGGDVSLAVLKGVLTKVAAEYFGLV